MNRLPKLCILALIWLGLNGSAISKDTNQQGFAVTQQLSHEALGHDLQAYPQGKVVETMSVSGYTYFQLMLDGKATWAATSSMTLAKGDKVILFKSYPMENFTSKSLNKTFDKILFVSQLDVVKNK